MADGLALTNEVDVATVGCMIGEHRSLPWFFGRFAFVVPASDTRFSQIVDGCPNKVADDPRLVLHFPVVAPSVARIALRLHHHAVGHTLVVALRFMNHVVVAHDVVLCCQRVVDVPLRVPCAECGGDGSLLWVELTAERIQVMGGLHHLNFLTLDDLVAR